MTKISFSITNDSVAVVVNGKSQTVRKGSPNFMPLCSALLAGDDEGVVKNLTVTKALAEWARGRFSLDADGKTFCYAGEALPAGLNQRIVEMATRGEDPGAFFKFWDKLQLNPSHRSVSQLWDFLSHLGIPLTDDGCFLAYKGVKADYTDCYTGSLDNSPGQVHSMPRNKISDDPEQPCHVGFHVGALSYAQSFCGSGGRVVICKVDPADVVCVPKDESFRKMRVSRYEVTGNFGGQLSNTFHEKEDLGGFDHTDDDFDDFDDFDDDFFGDEDVDYGDDEDNLPKAKPVKVKGPEVVTLAQCNKMTAPELLNLTIEQLRQYAGKGLKIVGASKIPGGKVSLIGRILEVRRKKA